MASQQETAANAAPQHAKRWRIVAAAFVTMAHAPGLHYAYGTLMVALMEANISTSRALLGGVGSLSTGAMLSGAYFSGRLQSRFGAARVVAAGGAVAAAGLALSAAATELWQLYVTFGLVVGLGHSLAFPPCPVAVAVAFSGSSDAALASGVATAGSGAGTVVLGVAARLLIVAAGWRATFGALALSTLVFVAGLAAPTLRGPQNRKPAAPVRETRPPQAPPLMTPRLRLLCAGVFVYAFGWEVPFVHLVAYAGDAGHAAAAASLVVVFVGAGGSLGRVAVARAADAKGVQPTFRAMLLATALADAALPLVIDSIAACYAYALVVGTTAGGCIALTTPMSCGCVAEGRLAEASGAVFSSMACGLVAGPFLAGVVYDVAGSYDAAFYGAAALWLAAFGICRGLGDEASRDTPVEPPDDKL